MLNSSKTISDLACGCDCGPIDLDRGTFDRRCSLSNSAARVKIAAVLRQGMVAAACVQLCQAALLEFQWVARSSKIMAQLPVSPVPHPPVWNNQK